MNVNVLVVGAQLFVPRFLQFSKHTKAIVVGSEGIPNGVGMKSVKKPPEGMSPTVKMLNLYTLPLSITPLPPMFSTLEGNGATFSSLGNLFVRVTEVHFYTYPFSPYLSAVEISKPPYGLRVPGNISSVMSRLITEPAGMIAVLLNDIDTLSLSLFVTTAVVIAPNAV